jgi:hypothetical protein
MRERNRGPKSGQRYVYDDQRPQRTYDRKFGGAVGKLISEASEGSFEGLFDFLESGPSFSEDEGRHLIWLIEKLRERITELEPRRQGRMRGPTSPAIAANHCAVYLVRVGLELYRKRHQCQRVPRKAKLRIIEVAVNLARRRFWKHPIHINPDISLPKITADGLEYAKEHFPNARGLMAPQ